MIVPERITEFVPPGHRGVRLAGVPAVSVVLVGTGAPERLLARARQLDLECTEHGAEFVVVWPGEVVDLDGLHEAAPSAKLVSADPAASAAELREQGLAVTQGDIVRIVDDASAPTPGWLGQFVADQHQRVDRLEAERRPVLLYNEGAGEPTPAHRYAPLRDGDRVVVVGGGPAGLTAAYLLAKRGVAVTVLEGDDVVGGISRTAVHNGYRFDIGGHRFFTKYEPVQELWEEILGEDFISVPRLSRIYYNNKFFDYPLRAANALRGLGVWNAVLIVLSYLKAHFRPHPVEENFEQWVTNRFGKRLYEIFFKTYTEKVWGIPCTEIRAEWAAQRIQGLSLAKAILSAASLNKRSTKIKTLIHEFQYPRLGPGQMWEMCAARIQDLGGEVLMRHRATAIETADGRVIAVRAEGPSGTRRLPADHCISTMPLRSLVRAIEPDAPASVRESGEGLQYRDFLVVALVLDRPNLFPDNWIYVHAGDVKVGRIQNFGNWSKAMLADQATSCLGLEYFCFKGDGLWTTDDADLIDLASRELSTLGLAEGTKVLDGAVVRMPKAYPIYDAVYRDHIETVRGFIDPIDNLHPIGRNGMHKYNNQDHSMLTAMMTVWNMLGASHDVWAVNTDFEYHEEQRLDEPSLTERPQAAAAGGG